MVGDRLLHWHNVLDDIIVGVDQANSGPEQPTATKAPDDDHTDETNAASASVDATASPSDAHAPPESDARNTVAAMLKYSAHTAGIIERASRWHAFMHNKLASSDMAVQERLGELNHKMLKLLVDSIVLASHECDADDAQRHEVVTNDGATTGDNNVSAALSTRTRKDSYQ